MWSSCAEMLTRTQRRTLGMLQHAPVVTYIGNYGSESCEDPATKSITEYTASTASLAVLVGLTLFYLVDAIHVLQRSSPGGDAVEAYIVMGFAIFGIAIDVTGLALYYRYANMTRMDAMALALEDSESSNESTESTDRCNTNGGEGEEGGGGGGHSCSNNKDMDEGPLPSAGLGTSRGDTNLNMTSSLLHVAADTVRSGATLVESLVLILNPFVRRNAEAADSVAAIFICSIILFGLPFGLPPWIRRTRFMWRRIAAGDWDMGGGDGTQRETADSEDDDDEACMCRVVADSDKRTEDRVRDRGRGFAEADKGGVVVELRPLDSSSSAVV